MPAPMVYLVPELERERYYPTKKEARAAQRAMEEPEPIIPTDAARECNMLLREFKEEERRRMHAELAVMDLVAIADPDLLATPEGKKALLHLSRYRPDFLRDCGITPLPLN